MKYRNTLVCGALMALGALVTAATYPRTPLLRAFLQSDLDGNQQCVTNLGCLQVSDLFATNIVTTNLTVQNINVQNVTYAGTNAGLTTEGYQMLPCDQGGGLQYYWWDFHHTNSQGQTLIYSKLVATNDILFIGPTNCKLWSVLTFSVVSWTNHMLYLPTNLPFFTTNSGTNFFLSTNVVDIHNAVLTNYVYGIHLSNQLFRMTLESNDVLESQWVLKP